MILTNNILLREQNTVLWVEGDQVDVLKKARDLIHRGHRLLTSPLAASGRMHFSPVRSILLTDEAEQPEEDSILAIENSLQLLETSLAVHRVDYKNKDDYGFIDNELLTQALNEINELNARYQQIGGNQFETGKTQG
ncbi:GrdX family protein [Clostridiaceae bacterium HFYG-1003]|nr:GrdX family protein [Clostridiaceae bacterium HFYG-1003]